METLLIHDTFTATNGTALAGRTPDTLGNGNVWLDPSDKVEIQSNKASRKADYSLVYDTLINTQYSEYTLEAEITCSAGVYAQLVFRADQTTNKNWAIWMNPPGNTSTRIDIDGFIYASGINLPAALVNGQSYNVKIVVTLDNFFIYWDNVLIVDASIDYASQKETHKLNKYVGIGFQGSGCTIDNFKVYINSTDNETYFKKNKLHVSTDIKFQLNNGTTLNDEQNITKYAVDINKLTEKLSKSSTVSGGVILPSLSLKLDNSRGVWNKQGAKFKNGFINNSLVKITTSYLDSDLNTITPSFVYKGIMKYSSSSWDREKFLFNTTLSPSTGLLSSEKIEAGILSNNTFAYIIYKILNRAPFNRYMTISQSNINLGWDVSSTDDVSDMVNRKVKDVLDKIMLLTGSVYYVDYDQNFIVEPIEESTPTALMTIRGQDILNIKSEEYYWDGQYTAVKWDDGENTVKRVEMNYTNRALYQYDYVELVLKDKYITDDAKRSTILNSLLNLYQFLKRMVKLTIKWTPSITVNKYVALDVPKESIKSSDQFIWNESQWNDGKFWNASQPGTTFSSGDLWRVLEVSRDTTGEKMDVVLLQHRSDDEK